MGVRPAVLVPWLYYALAQLKAVNNFTADIRVGRIKNYL